MTTQKHRENPLFLRDGFPSDERSDIPIIHDSESITAERLRSITWIPCSSARKNDSRSCDRIGVHHFVGDEHIPNIHENPERTLEKYSQYSILITPDNSTYREMPRPIQICAVFRSRWVGAFWQSHGLTAIPSVTWSGPESFTFCFDGLEPFSVVAVSTVGCKRGHEAETFFMRGYNVLLERIHPRLVLCVGTPFIGMAPATTSLIVYPYEYPRKKRD